jgi:MoaA/NifB/PqqE/SkfB family radical SAM enzyme
LSLWVTGLRDNLHELPDVVDLAARVGVEEVYLQRMVFWGEGLAVEQQSIYRGPRQADALRAEVEATLAEAEPRAARGGVRLSGADACSPRASLLENPPSAEPWRACSRPLRLAYVTARGTALPCCIAPFTDAPYDSITLGNYLADGVEAVWTGEPYREFRERLYSSQPPECCRGCGLAWSL